MQTDKADGLNSIEAPQNDHFSRTTLMPGDIVTDARGGTTGYVVIDHLPGQASDYAEVDTYCPVNVQHGVDEFDDVYRCITLPNTSSTGRLKPPLPAKILPESVLVRYPIEAGVDDMEVPLPAHVVARFLLSLHDGKAGREAYYSVFETIEDQEEFDTELIMDAIRLLLEVSDEN